MFVLSKWWDSVRSRPVRAGSPLPLAFSHVKRCDQSSTSTGKGICKSSTEHMGLRNVICWCPLVHRSAGARLMWLALKHRFSKCHRQTRIPSFTWKPATNANSQAPTSTPSETCGGGGVGGRAFMGSPGSPGAHSRLKTTPPQCAKI